MRVLLLTADLLGMCGCVTMSVVDVRTRMALPRRRRGSTGSDGAILLVSPLCAVCMEGYALSGSTCEKCTGSGANVFLVALFVMAASGGLTVAVRRATNAWKQYRLKRQIVGATSRSAGSAAAALKIMVRMLSEACSCRA